MAQRGRPFEAGNKFGRGRPRGSKNKTTILAQQLLDSRAEPIAAKALTMALQGDKAALRIVMDRILPVRRETRVNIGTLPTKTSADVSKAFERVLDQVASGKVSITDGQGFGDLLDKRRRAIQTDEIEQRLRALENKYAKS